ncbi:hypothetical protein A2G07_07470 [Deinococcus radiodurans R1 = ATCC 13939 = DSM 20539]|nr:hypothetical protein A2G07_07470 [Deinococcus radiodurans R1 = ATCC 13939 = DSM 20539]
MAADQPELADRDAELRKQKPPQRGFDHAQAAVLDIDQGTRQALGAARQQQLIRAHQQHVVLVAHQREGAHLITRECRFGFRIHLAHSRCSRERTAQPAQPH